MKKLSNKQAEVIKLMSEGWELGHNKSDIRGYSNTWLQKDGLGRGGETKEVHFNTFQALLSKKLIYDKSLRNYPTTLYALTK